MNPLIERMRVRKPFIYVPYRRVVKCLPSVMSRGPFTDAWFGTTRWRQSIGPRRPPLVRRTNFAIMEGCVLRSARIARQGTLYLPDFGGRGPDT